jgi:hypothetical protein
LGFGSPCDRTNVHARRRRMILPVPSSSKRRYFWVCWGLAFLDEADGSQGINHDPEPASLSAIRANPCTLSHRRVLS